MRSIWFLYVILRPVIFIWRILTFFLLISTGEDGLLTLFFWILTGVFDVSLTAVFDEPLTVVLDFSLSLSLSMKISFFYQFASTGNTGFNEI